MHRNPKSYDCISIYFCFSDISDIPELCSRDSHHPFSDEQRSQLTPVGTTVLRVTRKGNGNWQPIEIETQRPHPRRRKGEHKSKLHEEFAWASAERPRHFIVTWDTLKEMNNHWYVAFQANEKVRRNGFFQRISKKRRFREQCGLAQGLFRRFVWQLTIQRVTQEWLNLTGGNFQVTRERRIGLVNCI